MDFISWLLALIGIGSDRAMHRSDRRAEVARLNAEVAGEVGRTLDILAMATPRPEDNKVKIASAKGFVDWDKTLHDYQEWRVTASRIPPWVQGVIDRYDAIFLEAGIR